MKDDFELSDEKYSQVQSELEGFPIGHIYAAKQVIVKLMRSGLCADDLIKYSEDLVLTTTRTESLARELGCGTRFSKPCPDCGAGTRVQPVNDSSCRMVGGNYNSVIRCSNIVSCGWDFFTEELVSSLVNKRMKSPGYVREINRLGKMRRIHGVEDHKEKGCSGCGNGS
jgi:hypothetical protein